MGSAGLGVGGGVPVAGLRLGSVWRFRTLYTTVGVLDVIAAVVAEEVELYAHPFIQNNDLPLLGQNQPNTEAFFFFFVLFILACAPLGAWRCAKYI